MKVYKGTDKNLQCRGFQYKVGKEYVEDKADLCHVGFHGCERPLDVFAYYYPANSRYFEAELDDVSDQRESDSKVCGKRIKISAEIGIPDLIEAQIEYVNTHATSGHTDPKAANAGNYGAANAWNCGAANAGDCGAANAGNYGAANAGNYGAANAGNCGAANAGDCGAANAGNHGAANAGNYGAATSRGSSSVGKSGIAISRGNGVKAKGALGAILLIAEEYDDNCDIKDWSAAVVDGNTIKANTWYTVKDGVFTEVEED